MKIDLSKLPEGTKWIAIDVDGSYEVAAFIDEPIIGPDGFYLGDGEYPHVIGEVRAVRR